MNKFLLIAIFPFLFSFVDPKIGGTITIDKSVQIKDLQKIKLNVSLISRNNVVATTTIKMPKFPQAFVLTERHKIDPKSNFEGTFIVLAELYDLDTQKKYESKLEAELGKKDLNLVIK